MRWYGDKTDDDLVIAARAPDPAAFNALHKRHYVSVRQWCKKLVRNDADADDATGQTFVNAYRGIMARQYDPPGNFKYWLRRIADNVCFDILRRLKYRHEVQSQEWNDCSPVPVDNVVRAVFLRNGIEKALAACSDDEQALLYLAYEQGLSYKEIGEITGWKVTHRLDKARQRFRAAFEAECPGEARVEEARGRRQNEAPNSAHDGLTHLNGARLGDVERAAAAHYQVDCVEYRDRLTRTGRTAETSDVLWERMKEDHSYSVPHSGFLEWAFTLVFPKQPPGVVGAATKDEEAEITFPASYESPDGSIWMRLDTINGRLALLVEKQGVDLEAEVVFVGIAHREETTDEAEDQDGVYLALEPSGKGWVSGEVILCDFDAATGMQISSPIKVDPKDTTLLHVRRLRDSILKTMHGEAAWKPWRSALPDEVREALDAALSENTTLAKTRF